MLAKYEEVAIPQRVHELEAEVNELADREERLQTLFKNLQAQYVESCS